jgi:hypothetical protein
MLKYEIKSILKQENENSVLLTLSLSSKLYFPFPIKRDQFLPLSFGIKLKIILSESPWQEHIVTDHELIEVTPKYDLLIEMPFSFSLEGLKGQILLNYEKTQYKNETQILDFMFEGSNYALKYDGNGATYKTFGYAMLVQNHSDRDKFGRWTDSAQIHRTRTDPHFATDFSSLNCSFTMSRTGHLVSSF